MSDLRLGVDIGGTFTDIVLIDDDRRMTKKISSTVGDYSRAIIDGVNALLSEHGLETDRLGEFLHATTVASNAVLEQKGARTGLITTKGFRDILEIRTLRMPKLYDLTWTKPPPLVERYLRREIDERIDGRGRIERGIEEEDVVRAVTALLDEKVEAIAVCLLHSYANPVHEQFVGSIVRKMAPKLVLCLSSDVLPEIKEYERTSTTVINAYVRPVVESYLNALVSELGHIGVKVPVHLMQSNGGLTTAAAAAVKPMNIIESGPAAGVVGAQALARTAGLSRAISFDMGGTTAKASLIENGEVSRAAEYSVGGGIMIGARLLSGSGYPLKVPAIDLAEVGAGGGSIIWIDEGGAFQIGPHSAGSNPGPVCYDKGNEEPTVTDANVVLGYLNPTQLAGGSVKLNSERAKRALEEKIAKPLGIETVRAAYGAHLVAASNMIRAIKAVSSERGRNPRDYGIIAFGGNGPIFAAGMARTLGIRQVFVPPMAGLFSAFGLLHTEVEYHFSATHKAPLASFSPGKLEVIFGGLSEQASQQLSSDGFKVEEHRLLRRANLRYHGQSFELSVPIPDGPITPDIVATLEEGFGAEHEATYGHRAGASELIEFVTAKVVGMAMPKKSRAPKPATRVGTDARVSGTTERLAYFGPNEGWLMTPVVARQDLVTAKSGPCIVEEYDTTCVVPPGFKAVLDQHDNIVLTDQT